MDKGIKIGFASFAATAAALLAMPASVDARLGQAHSIEQGAAPAIPVKVTSEAENDPRESPARLEPLAAEPIEAAPSPRR